MDREPVSDVAWVLGCAALYVPLGVAAIAWVAWRHGAAEVAVRLGADAPSLAAAGGVVAGLAVVAFTRAASRFGPLARLAGAMREMFGALSTPACLALAALSSLSEELVFRVALQPEVGLLPASLLFGLAHVPLERDLLAWPVFAAAMGLLLGALYAVTGGIEAPVACHFVVNALNLRWLARSA